MIGYIGLKRKAIGMPSLKFETSRFGTIEIDDANLITFVTPILGFDDIQEFVLLDHADDSPFKWLQATQEPNLAFVVTNPSLFGIPYEFGLPESAVKKLDIEKAEDVVVFTIVRIPEENPSDMTANFLAPIVVNQNNLKAMQVILQDSKFSTRVRLLPEEGAPSEGEVSPESSEGKDS